MLAVDDICAVVIFVLQRRLMGLYSHIVSVMNISASQCYLQLFSVYLANVITTFTLVMDHLRGEVTTSFIK
jgi:hypothetical protein